MTGQGADAREQIARWLVREYGELLDRDPPGYWEFQARELIADCPAVAEALAAVERVRMLAEEIQTEGEQLQTRSGLSAWVDGQRALDDAARVRAAIGGYR